ncbi:MAG: DNA-processing protein DprA [Rhodospirillaceae bacterium]|nr:DNA-processing protein DprA [Rhodospirillaceae bacterium]MDE0618119.1 DNA-processing protein DprA [Rhodospirillaceae bacterium]
MIADLRTQAVLLLTVSLGRADRDGAKPLSPSEWARLAEWLEDRDLDPAALMTGDPEALLSGWVDRTVTPGRLDGLLGRGAALGLAAEKWQRAGLWLLARPDPGYPARLEKRLERKAPPVLFGCGRAVLLNPNRSGLAVVGSRGAGEEELAFSGKLGAAAARDGRSIVSGGARGVDRAAMKGALDSEGTAVAVLADGLLHAATSALYRRPLLSGDLALVSAVNPETGFNVGNAMARNRYIYCLADAAVVVASARGSGGTWSGACENAKEGWVPLWVRHTSDPNSGNHDLVEQKGARRLPDRLDSLAALFEQPDAAPAPVPERVFGEPQSPYAPASDTPVSTASAGKEHHVPTVPNHLTFYGLFLAKLTAATAQEPLSGDAIAQRFDIAKTQAKKWLARGVAVGKVERVTGPVRYRAPPREHSLPLDEPPPEPSALPDPEIASAESLHRTEFQDLFQARLDELTAAEPCSADNVAQSLVDVTRHQVQIWLRRSVAGNKIRKSGKPVRYSRPE